ncbi:hypothetical protein A3G67_02480 [Candidatus Roizmanbacteria bacterium RIFCSPLOWO2_12_FULL_40_12]|nr:MAG: hypothetical protein A2779_03770 [Candidatus Roizmanbacteria bacterium RIFCSPHIGHO2_01_FULL_40_98]OGK27850.1 MAG: hypothetical protein A3C31_03735 [Candidatus Roizmanbacteria bacterium RIFCSPHIGHO2_02_FULL_40_53]OGK29400.1 MAG: hypothetical protein A2W49_04100 [Candidatus Roizmanbacteria bacterium RIFCSPHIGHO2_12_41_18]OGK59114.1 MAG: hypothetical protein A3H84_01335 [Candidatus Roizmanbacteria bacterium RIFCSPLOWO2_02_FULL_40_13]OGK61684.1 MAG: hypothetical protein A3G67_02480 [Candida
MAAFDRRKYKRPGFDPRSSEPFRISRSKIDLFYDCPRCFYLDRRLRISRPSLPGFSLNSAVDHLLKKEFDLLREKGQAHELMKKYKIDAIPLKHPDLGIWRDDVYRYEGASALHKPTNFLVSGIIDDVWKDSKGDLVLVDYKSTSTSKEISLEDRWKQGYKRQMEVYQWIFRQLGFKVSEVGYFVFANAGKTKPKFDGVLEFEMSVVSHRGDTSWIEPILKKMKDCLMSDVVPKTTPECEYCVFSEDSSTF